MKSQHVRRLVCAFWIAAVLPAGALTLYWDPGITGGAAGGATTGETSEWKASGAGNVWWDGSANVGWANGNDATFAGTAGNVRMGGNNATISLGTLTFSVAGYTIDLKDFTDNTANNLTVTGIGGSTATINNTSTTTRSFNINCAADQTWSGTINGDRILFNKQGVGTLNFSGALPAAFGTTSVDIQAGKLKLTGATVQSKANVRINVANGAILDLNGNSITFAAVGSATSGSVTNSSDALATITSNYGGAALTMNGVVAGNIKFVLRDSNVLTLGGNNNFPGGVNFGNSALYGTVNTALTVTHDNGLGTGPVELSASNGTLNFNLRSAAPNVGSLAGGNTAIKNVNLGNTGIDTTLSVGALGTSTYFMGFIKDFTGRKGSVTKVGGGMLSLGNTNTYSGRTTVSVGTLALPKKSGFTAGTLKYTCVNESAVITITTGSPSLLVPGQPVSGTSIPANTMVSSISGNSVTLTAAATGNGSNVSLTASAMDGSLASGDLRVDGGTFVGSGTVGFRLNLATDGMVLTSGTLDVSSLAIKFTDTPILDSYTLVDYSAGGTATFATNVDTANSFASATNIPEGYKINHDTTAKLVTLQEIPLATLVIIR